MYLLVMFEVISAYLVLKPTTFIYKPGKHLTGYFIVSTYTHK